MINMQLIIKIIFVTSNVAAYFFVMNKINELLTSPFISLKGLYISTALYALSAMASSINFKTGEITYRILIVNIIIIMTSIFIHIIYEYCKIKKRGDCK